MNKTLLIIDGHNLLFQMYYGMPNKIFGQKYPFSIHGVLGFVGGLIKICKLINPTHLCIIFDGEFSNFRLDINNNYKQNRPIFTDVCDNENPFSNLPIILDVLKYLKIVYYELTVDDNFEADDVIASISNRFNGQVYISSSDRDFLQLVNENIKLLTYRGKKTVIYDQNVIFSKYGVTPNQIVDYKALIGDNSDNIKGVKGIGPITAKSLLQQFLTIENIYDNISLIKTNIKTKLLSNKELIFQNRRLIKLDHHIPYKQQLDSKEMVIKIDYENLKTINILKKLAII